MFARTDASALTVVSSMYGMGMFIPGTEVSLPEPPEEKPKQRTCRKGSARSGGSIRDRKQNMMRLVAMVECRKMEILGALRRDVRDVTSPRPELRRKIVSASPTRTPESGTSKSGLSSKFGPFARYRPSKLDYTRPAPAARISLRCDSSVDDILHLEWHHEALCDSTADDAPHATMGVQQGRLDRRKAARSHKFPAW